MVVPAPRNGWASVDHAWTIHADEADVIAVYPMHAGHVGKAVPVRAVVGGQLAVIAFDGGESKE